jgi:hypothetical protein
MKEEEFESYRVDDTEYQNVQKSFDSVEERIVQCNFDQIIAEFNTNPYRINQTNQYREGGE